MALTLIVSYPHFFKCSLLHNHIAPCAHLFIGLLARTVIASYAHYPIKVYFFEKRWQTVFTNYKMILHLPKFVLLPLAWFLKLAGTTSRKFFI